MSSRMIKIFLLWPSAGIALCGPQLRALHNLVEANQRAFIVAWDEHFGR